MIDLTLEQRLADFVTYHAHITKIKELNPSYLVVKEVGEGAAPESRLWLTFLYAAYYHIGSALKTWEAYPMPELPAESFLTLPCSTERRGHRSPRKLQKHIEAIIEVAKPNGLTGWVQQIVASTPEKSWERTQTLLGQLWGNGRWACYNTGEMLMKINGYPLKPTDMGHSYSTGPREGLKLLYPDIPEGNSEREVKRLDKISTDLVNLINAQGIEGTIETVETSLCGYHSLVYKRTYVGYEIDTMLSDLHAVPSGLTDKAIAARARIFPPEYLGELTGRIQPELERKRHYAMTGQIVTR
jgi:hypothetical protein